MAKQKSSSGNLGKMRKRLGAVKEQLKDTLSLVEGSGEECGVDEGACLAKSDVIALRKDLSKISTIVRRFADELEISEYRQMIEDYDAIDYILEKNSELLKGVAKGMDSKVEKISESEPEPKDEDDEEENDEEDDEEEDEIESRVSSLGTHRRIEKGK